MNESYPELVTPLDVEGLAPDMNLFKGWDLNVPLALAFVWVVRREVWGLNSQLRKHIYDFNISKSYHTNALPHLLTVSQSIPSTALKSCHLKSFWLYQVAGKHLGLPLAGLRGAR